MLHIKVLILVVYSAPSSSPLNKLPYRHADSLLVPDCDRRRSFGIVNSIPLTKAAIRDDSWHHLSCNAHKRREINIRHDTVVHALYTHATQSGAAAVKEPVGLSTEDGRRPDLQVVIPGESLLTDVVVSNGLCPTHLAAASNEGLSCT